MVGRLPGYTVIFFTDSDRHFLKICKSIFTSTCTSTIIFYCTICVVQRSYIYVYVVLISIFYIRGRVLQR